MNKEKKLKIFLVVFVLLAIILAAYIFYDKVILTNNYTTDFKEELKDEQENINKEYYVLNDEKKQKKYIVSKEKDTYDVVYDIDDSNYIGVYDNKIYYTQNDKINYIDLSENTLKEKQWISKPNIDGYDDGDYLITKAVIVKDNMYFSYSAGGMGLYSLKMNAKDISEAIKVLDDNDMSDWWFSEDELNIYYVPEYTPNTKVVPKVYNIKNKTKNQLLEHDKYRDAESIKYVDNKIIYYYLESDLYDSNYNKIYSCNCTPYHKLYILDVNTKETNFISNISREKYFAISDIYNGKLYYMKDNVSIYQYDINNKTEIKYYDDIKSNKDVVGIKAISEQVLKIYYNFGEIEYIINGELKSPENLNVKMLDNQINTYNIYDLIKIK
ncbi:MAG: hypothetical protein IJN03_01740 [Bacilli bacterium]|nr:hypothetical protein [Bacilli bacterium]